MDGFAAAVAEDRARVWANLRPAGLEALEVECHGDDEECRTGQFGRRKSVVNTFPWPTLDAAMEALRMPVSAATPSAK